MAFDLSKNLVLLDEIFNSTNIQNAEVLNTKKQQNPKNPKTTKSKTQSFQKENIASEISETKKISRESKKNERQPLKVLSTRVKSPKKSVSPKGNKNIIPSGRKSSAKNNASPSKPKTTKKEKVSLPKVIVYEDPSVKANVPEKESKKKSFSGLSKSWDGSVTRSRRSQPDSRKSPKLEVSKTKNMRRSLNDLTSIKSPAKKKISKKVAEGSKSPTSGRTRLPKLKPGQPEFEEMFAKLENMFPNVDPEFMKTQFIKYKGSLLEVIEFLMSKEKTDGLPTKTEYLRRLEAEKLQNKFLENFSVENFLKMIPDPWEHFLKTEKHNCASYFGHSLYYLKNKYKRYYIRSIQEALTKNEYSLYLADKELKKKSRTLKMRATNRSKYECDSGRPNTFNIQFVHEVAFIENEKQIKSHLKKAVASRYKKFKEAEKAGTLIECQSCNDFSLLQDDVVNCPDNHVFCKDCVVKYVEIEIGKDNFKFKCLLKCEKSFSMETLQAVLNPLVMELIIKRNQLEEIKSAGINDLVCCPFCPYVIIMPPELSVFKCFNPGCMIESCRYCKKLNHLPLKCNELEKFDEMSLEAEVEIEEQEYEEMKEEIDSLVKCTQCDGEFLKREDSNQMVCPCGTTICSICRQPFQECQHFNAEPRNESYHDLSSSSDENEIDENVVKEDIENISKNLLGWSISESENF